MNNTKVDALIEEPSVAETVKKSLSKEAITFIQSAKESSDIDNYVALLEILSLFFQEQKKEEALEIEKKVKKTLALKEKQLKNEVAIELSKKFGATVKSLKKLEKESKKYQDTLREKEAKIASLSKKLEKIQTVSSKEEVHSSRKKFSEEDGLSFLFSELFPYLDQANKHYSPYILPYNKDKEMPLVLKVNDLRDSYVELINGLAKALNISQASVINTIILAWFKNLGFK